MVCTISLEERNAYSWQVSYWYIQVGSRTYSLWVAGPPVTVSPQLRWERKGDFLHIAGVVQPLHTPLHLCSLLLPVSWHMRMVCSVQTSATWVVYIGLHLDLWVTAHCPDHNKPAPTWLIPSGTGYLSPWWSTFFDNLQYPHWKDTFLSWLTEVASKGWGLVPVFQSSCQCPGQGSQLLSNCFPAL